MRNIGGMGTENDKQVLQYIDELVKQEHELRVKVQRGEIATEDERKQLAAAEVELDQCWDLLRQRRARREFGDDPDGAQPSPAQQVEGYLQ